MRVRTIDPAHIDQAVIAEAAAVITRGGLVAFPTETVYGLGSDATNAIAVQKIFTAKGRPGYNPLIVHVADVNGAMACVSTWPDAADTLASRFWPGPLTIVLPKRQEIPDIVTAGLKTVGVRVPAHAVAQALIRAAGVPIAAPSANRSMHVSPTAGDHVASSLGDAADLILDAGPASVGIESTVIDLSAAVPTILRPGMISIEELRGALGRVQMAAGSVTGETARPSPGMMDRHYSPSARLLIAESAGAAKVAAARELAAGARVVILARSSVDARGAVTWRMPDEGADYARVLYGMLHRADAESFDVIVVEAVPAAAAWDGVRDRLERAAR
jgi:L-threonylcarbamoyladenylate synthase